MQNYRIDSHKLIYHPKEVSKWMDGDAVYPIMAEIGLSGVCNHKCIFCCIAHMDYKPSFIEQVLLLDRIKEMKSLGLKSIMLAGNGEPLTHKNFTSIVRKIKSEGIDIALSTNGVLFTKKIADEILDCFSWIRFSISAGTEETYKKIQRGQDGDLQRVLSNIEYASNIKKQRNIKTVLGVQIVMTPENANEILLLANLAKEYGANWFTVKTVGWNPLDVQYKNNVDLNVLASDREDLASKLENLSDENYKAIFRSNRFEIETNARGYDECYAAPFYTAIDSNGDVYPCCNMIGVPYAVLGNIHNTSFKNIWDGTRRKEVMQEFAKRKLKDCPLACRLSNMNRYLKELKYPGDHVNFI